MPLTVEFTVPGNPIGKGRPRFTRIGHAYTPKETVQYEEHIRRCYKEQCGDTMLDGAIRMMLMVYVPVPKSAPKKKREQMLLGEIRPLTKPDNSNILKGVEDALNGVAYIDDKQICDHDGIHKFYSENPRIEVTLREV